MPTNPQPQFFTGSSPAVVAENVKLLKVMGYDEQQAMGFAIRLAGGASGPDMLGVQMKDDKNLPNQTGRMDPRLLATQKPNPEPLQNGERAQLKPFGGMLDNAVWPPK